MTREIESIVPAGTDQSAPVQASDATARSFSTAPPLWQTLVFRVTSLAVLILAAGLALSAWYSFNGLADEIERKFRASSNLQAQLLSDRLASYVRAYDVDQATETALEVMEFDNTAIIAVRAIDAFGDVVFDVVHPRVPNTLDLIVETTVPETTADTSTADGFLVLDVDVVSAAGRGSPPAGRLIVVFDTTDLIALLQREWTAMLLAETILAFALGGLICVLMVFQVARPIRRVIQVMEAVAEDRTDVDLKDSGAAEVRQIKVMLDVFRENVLKRKASEARSADAERATLALEQQKREAEDAERAQAAKRAAEDMATARRELEHQERLHRDLDDILASASRGDFAARMVIDEAPEGQRHLRGMINALLMQIESGVGDVISVLSRLEDGILAARVTGKRQGAFAQLQTSTNALAAHLEDAMRELSKHAKNMLDETEGLSDSAEMLAKRTERTASSLTETASVLDRIVDRVTSTAEMTGQMTSVARQSSEDAHLTDKIVQDAVSAMQSIKRESLEISKTLSVIEDIAFQTNLLALNAGVEAARAGEAGRGFAVVASEVRALAGRAADAAQQIGSLIESSARQIDVGESQVARTGDSLSTLSGRIAEIGKRAAEIAASTEEQADAVQDINRSLSDIDRATKENTAMFEEVTQAHSSLKSGASQMLGLMAAFEITAEETAAADVGARDVDAEEVETRHLVRRSA